MEEQCELCEKKAMVHCDSDQANLCWGCDAIVHSANFLVEKHMRILLCRICNSHTQWKACGSKLIPSASLCHRCMVDDDGGNSSDDVESDSEDDDSEKEDEEENQVVPLYSPLSLDSAASALNTQPVRSLSIKSHLRLFLFYIIFFLPSIGINAYQCP
ncbi:hypothetical protein TanjilG_21747 [Lupinus angustifolius]|uniref:B box-type domain-containing protein n=1 Tax=Lupinus angustifolius TaxID=3871 RepID=A0A1J7I0L0_LUPAN|nr:hypothetical protein TanjilG_21747 [Lupinus angustifolius]